MDDEKIVWGIHTPALNDRMFLDDGLIAIGWDEMGDLSGVPDDLNKFREKYLYVYPDAAQRKMIVDAGMLYKFIHQVKNGDYIVFPSKSDRNVNIGVVEGDYYFDNNEPNFPHQRKVRWIKTLMRTSFSQGALYEMGSFLTLFTIKNYRDEILRAINKTDVVLRDEISEEDDTVVTAEEIENSTKDFILKELYGQLKGYDLENFVASLLNAMGYRTRISKHGGDSGIDIIAFKDELPPRIVVQVKSSNGDIPETTVHSLKGAMNEGDYGLFVTLSNYTPKAKEYLASKPIIRGINGTELVELILKYYDDLDEKYKKMIPLKKAYIPVIKEQEQE